MENYKEKRVLIVDDDPVLREVAASSLKREGIHVEIAENGTIAMKKLSTNDYDLAIIDMDMPGASGIDVITHLRKNGLNPQMPALVITGRDGPASLEKAYEAGATSFLPQPVNWNFFYNQVRFLIHAGENEKKTCLLYNRSGQRIRLKANCLPFLLIR